MRCIVFILLCTLAVPSFAGDPAPVRLALLTGDGERAISDAALAQVEATLTGMKEVTLLERAEIKKILAEQKISAAGLSDPATAVKMGKLLSVEMFLFVERVPKTDPATARVEVVDTVTGIALVADIMRISMLGQKDSTALSERPYDFPSLPSREGRALLAEYPCPPCAGRRR